MDSREAQGGRASEERAGCADSSRDDIPMTLAQYFASHVHLGRLWAEHLWFETDWFVKSLRGELPPAKQLKNYTITHIYLPPNRYYLALEALSTRMGVKPQDAKPR